MNRFFGSLLAIAFAVSVAPAAYATTATKCPTGETYTKGYTKADGTKVSGYCSTKGSKAAPAAAATSASKMAPAAMATAKAAPAAAATAAGSMNKAATSATKSTTAATKSATGAMSCPPGKTYVNGYTKANGTKVAGYCRSAPSK